MSLLVQFIYPWNWRCPPLRKTLKVLSNKALCCLTFSFLVNFLLLFCNVSSIRVKFAFIFCILFIFAITILRYFFSFLFFAFLCVFPLLLWVSCLLLLFNWNFSVNMHVANYVALEGDRSGRARSAFCDDLALCNKVVSGLMFRATSSAGFVVN